MTQLTIDFGEPKENAEAKRAKEILRYTNLIHTCVTNVYEHLVDREYQDFQDEVETAIEFLEYLRDNGDKRF